MEIYLAILLLVLSSFFSSTEIAFVAVNRVRLEVKSRSSKSAQIALQFLKSPEKFLVTVLIGNNLVNLAFGSILTFILKVKFNMDDFSILIFITLVLLIFGEAIPKSIARESPFRFTLLSAYPLKLFYFLFLPAVKISAFLSSKFSKVFKIKSENIKNFFSKKDIEILVKEVELKNAAEIPFSKVFRLSVLPVKDVMRPRAEMVAVEKSMPLQEVYKVFASSGYSRIPVYEKTPDNIVGVLYVKDLFKKPRSIDEVLREPLFVPESKKCIEVLKEFKKSGTSFAIVVDEFGGTSGIVTTEDIVEELVGEIEDEFDSERKVVRKIGENTFVLSGTVEVEYLNREFDLKIPKGDYETIAGYLISRLGRIPAKGEEFIIDTFKFTIISATKTRVNALKLTILKS